MILKSIYIDLNRDEFNTEEVYNFLKKSRHVLNFVERECFSKIKFKSENKKSFKRLVIRLSKNQDLEGKLVVNSENILIYNIAFDENDYINSINDGNISKYFINILKKNLKIINQKIKLPLNELIDCLKQFEKRDFLNEWIVKKKANRKLKLNFILLGRLTPDNFFLKLEVYKKTDKIYSRPLLKLDPDENAYYYRFEDIIFKEDKFILTSKISTSSLLEESYKNILNSVVD